MGHSLGSSEAAVVTAVLVMNLDPIPMLCPFFAKCDGVLLFNAADGSNEFHPWDRNSADLACDFVLKLKPRRLICGFIGEPEKEKLRAAGIDVRLGSCNCSVDYLVTSFTSLPRA
jgi:predicted Fe-Mo cluster-binding NifX family protein